MDDFGNSHSPTLSRSRMRISRKMFLSGEEALESQDQRLNVRIWFGVKAKFVAICRNERRDRKTVCNQVGSDKEQMTCVGFVQPSQYQEMRYAPVDVEVRTVCEVLNGFEDGVVAGNIPNNYFIHLEARYAGLIQNELEVFRSCVLNHPIGQ